MKVAFLLAAAAPSLLTVPARAACGAGAQVEPGAPARVGAGLAGLGQVPETCARSELALSASGSLLIATADFYGGVEATGALRARFALDPSFWVSFTAPSAHYRYYANATVETSSLDLGASAVGAHFGLPVSHAVAVSPFVRVLVPTETVFVSATRYGFDHGVSVTWRAARAFELLGGFAFPAFFTDAFGTVHTELEPTLDVQGSVSPFSRFTALYGFALRVRAGDTRGFESFDPKLGLRFLPLSELRIELAAAFPLAGDDRTDALLGLDIAWMLDPLP